MRADESGSARDQDLHDLSIAAVFSSSRRPRRLSRIACRKAPTSLPIFRGIHQGWVKSNRVATVFFSRDAAYRATSADVRCASATYYAPAASTGTPLRYSI